MIETDKQRITLQLDAHRVALTVPREAEPDYRNAAELLNRRYKRFAQQLPQASPEQLWMYTALEMAVSLQADTREKSLSPIEKEMKRLTQQIQDTLNTQTTNPV